jgi:hypothetical protein
VRAWCANALQAKGIAKDVCADNMHGVRSDTLITYITRVHYSHIHTAVGVNLLVALRNLRTHVSL